MAIGGIPSTIPGYQLEIDVAPMSAVEGAPAAPATAPAPTLVSGLQIGNPLGIRVPLQDGISEEMWQALMDLDAANADARTTARASASARIAEIGGLEELEQQAKAIEAEKAGLAGLLAASRAALAGQPETAAALSAQNAAIAGMAGNPAFQNAVLQKDLALQALNEQLGELDDELAPLDDKIAELDDDLEATNAELVDIEESIVEINHILDTGVIPDGMTAVDENGAEIPVTLALLQESLSDRLTEKAEHLDERDRLTGERAVVVAERDAAIAPHAPLFNQREALKTELGAPAAVTVLIADRQEKLADAEPDSMAAAGFERDLAVLGDRLTKTALETALADKKAARTQEQANLAAAQAGLHAAQTTLAGQQGIRDGLVTQIGVVAGEIAAIDTQIAELEAAEGDNTAAIDALKDERDAKVAEQAGLEAQRTAAETAIAGLHANIAMFNNAIVTHTNAIATLNTGIATLGARLTAAAGVAAEQEAIDTLDEQLNALVAEAESARATAIARAAIAESAANAQSIAIDIEDVKGNKALEDAEEELVQTIRQSSPFLLQRSDNFLWREEVLRAKGTAMIESADATSGVGGMIDPRGDAVSLPVTPFNDSLAAAPTSRELEDRHLARREQVNLARNEQELARKELAALAEELANVMAAYRETVRDSLPENDLNRGRRVLSLA